MIDQASRRVQLVGSTPHPDERFMRQVSRTLSAADDGFLVDRIVPFGERHLRRAIAEVIEHYHGERNYQGLANELIDGAPPAERCGTCGGGARLRYEHYVHGFSKFRNPSIEEGCSQSSRCV